MNTILASARYAYAHTPDTESKLRAHYLALIIRCRGTFKRSGTMQMEMEKGGKLFFDLFVAMCNHMVCPFLDAAGLGRVAGLLSDWELWLMDFRMMFSRLCRFAVLLRQKSDRELVLDNGSWFDI